jgi:proteasome lid subunit RPN8/RPN11
MLRLKHSDYTEIRRHGEQAYPHECCGILLGNARGDARLVAEVIRCVNRSPGTTETSYAIDARDLVRAQRAAREHGLEIIGFYHSHPDHLPAWSPTDLAEAHWVGCSYVITSVVGGTAAATNSYLLHGTVEEDKVLIEEEVLVEGPVRWPVA